MKIQKLSIDALDFYFDIPIIFMLGGFLFLLIFFLFQRDFLLEDSLSLKIKEKIHFFSASLLFICVMCLLYIIFSIRQIGKRIIHGIKFLVNKIMILIIILYFSIFNINIDPEEEKI